MRGKHKTLRVHVYYIHGYITTKFAALQSSVIENRITPMFSWWRLTQASPCQVAVRILPCCTCHVYLPYPIWCRPKIGGPNVHGLLLERNSDVEWHACRIYSQVTELDIITSDSPVASFICDLHHWVATFLDTGIKRVQSIVLYFCWIYSNYFHRNGRIPGLGLHNRCVICVR